ncbi:ATP-dependent nuclease [Embleya sp. NPDC050493]|uniref:ATP-dependent nuclease n=1 Tax=Embleya sp. NPDC050493 TaxID=3363989 RepID=UPI0037B5FD3C
MYLLRIRVKNFRNFADLEIDPLPTPAVIVGENGIGKSNLLDALRLLLDPDLPRRKRKLQPDDIHSGAGKLADGVEVTVEVDLAGFDDSFDARAELEGAIISEEPLVARLTYVFGPKESWTGSTVPLTVDDYDWKIFGGDDRQRGMVDAMRYVGLSVLPALRDAEGDLARSDRSPLTRMLREMPPSPANVEAALRTMQQARLDLGKDPNVRKIAELIGARVAKMGGPRASLEPTLAFIGRDDELLRSIRIFIDGAATCGVDRASTGTANVLYLALLLERLQLRRGAVDGEDTLLAVEEPEAHLHPTLQRHLFAHLLGEPTRLVLTTHSPHIAAVSPLESLVLLMEQDEATVARVLRPGLLAPTQLADMQRYMNVHRAEMLFARASILVEGAAETYILPAIVRAAGFDLDTHGIVVVNVEGTDFLPYARLLGPSGWNRPFRMLTDGDATDHEAQTSREPGLARAKDVIGVIGKAGDTTAFTNDLDKLCEEPLPALSAGRPGRAALVSTAAEFGVFVSCDTLEIDILPLLAQEMKEAFNEFAEGPIRRSNFADAVDRAALEGTEEDRKFVLARIDEIGKGRYAQRLAAHVEGIDLSARIRMLLGNAPEDKPVSTADLLALHGSGPLLALLDTVRREAEGLGLSPTPNEIQEAAGTGEASAEEVPPAVPEPVTATP